MFDTKVHHRDPKTAKVVKVNPYRCVINPMGTTYFRNGKQYHPDGSIKFDPAVEAEKAKAKEEAAKAKVKAVEAEKAPVSEPEPLPPPVEAPPAPSAEVPVEAPVEQSKVESKGKKSK